MKWLVICRKNRTNEDIISKFLLIYVFAHSMFAYPNWKNCFDWDFLSRFLDPSFPIFWHQNACSIKHNQMEGMTLEHLKMEWHFYVNWNFSFKYHDMGRLEAKSEKKKNTTKSSNFCYVCVCIINAPLSTTLNYFVCNDD